MKLKVRVLGRYRDIVGSEELTLEVLGGNTLRDVVSAFVKKYPTVEKDKKIMIVLKDRRNASRETRFCKDDEITLCPPVVSGG